MISTTVGQLLIQDALPEDLRQPGVVLDKKGIGNLLTKLGQQHPEKYRETLHKLMQLSRDFAYFSGGNSFGLRHLRAGQSTTAARQRINQAIQGALADPDLPEEQRQERINAAVDAERDKLTDDLYKESLDEKNPLALQVLSGSRGNPTNLRSLRGFDGAYEDHNNNRIGLPILRNYSEGLSPAEYWAGTYGARKGVIDVKACLSGETLVLMADWSTKRIDQIMPGDMVFGCNSNGDMVPTRVVRRYDNGTRECFRWKFRVSSTQRFVSMVATGDHEVLSEVREGQPGSTYVYRSDYTPRLRRLATARLQKNPTKNTFVACPSRGYGGVAGYHEPLALLYGLLLGDGCCTTTWTLSCGDDQLIADTAEYLAGFGLRLNPPIAGYSWNFSNDTTWPFQRDELGRITGSGNPHYARLTELGVRCLAHEKRMTPEIDQWDNESILCMLAGLFATDGCVEVRPGGVSLRLAMTAKHVVEDVQRLLELRFGIWCTAVRHVPIRGNMKHEQWAFEVSHQESVRRFHQIVPLVGVKRPILDTAVAAFVQRPRNMRLGFKIFSKDRVGEIQTYDLEVEHPDHMFVLANGLVVSNSTADAGYLAKQLVQVAHRLLVSDTDDKDDPDNKYVRGLPVKVHDQDSAGALLAIPHGKYARNTVLTPKILRDLEQQGYDDILIRSPMVGGPADGGVYARDVGVRERGGRIAPLGDYVGVAAAQALSEKLTQAQLSSKHSGGVAGAGPTGFDLVDQLVQVPTAFRGGATHAQLDGTVSAIKAAPQGGQYIHIGDTEHYVPPDFPIKVKVGDEVEAGDVMSDGIPNPDEIVRHKGIGEGKRYFTNVFRDAYRRSGMNVNRRNIELISRGLINHVRMNDVWNDYAPDDVVPYSMIERNWQPRPGTTMGSPSANVGKYLEVPTLHYSIGTKIRKSMLPQLKQFGVQSVQVHNDPPPFAPEMLRAATSISTDPDPMTRMLGSGQKGSLLDATHYGATSDMAGTSYVPALVAGTPFGKVGPTGGWKPEL